jgi:AcrR family transcriptional regulator
MTIMKRLTREERRARTRDDLLAAATRVFARRGYRAATLEEVAAEAGLTTGAVYSNFSGKHDLFLAALEAEVARHVREADDAVAGAGKAPAAKAQAAARQWEDFLAAEPEKFLMFMEYWAYAVRDEDARPQFATVLGALRDSARRRIELETGHDGWSPPLPADELAIIVNALANGIALERLTDPEGVPDDLYEKALALLLRS